MRPLIWPTIWIEIELKPRPVSKNWIELNWIEIQAYFNNFLNEYWIWIIEFRTLEARGILSISSPTVIVSPSRWNSRWKRAWHLIIMLLI